MCTEAGWATTGGAQGSENAGMSNRNAREIRAHRKSKVSWAMAIIPGLVGPKARPKGVVDGHTVNIPRLSCYLMEGRIAVLSASNWIHVGVLRTYSRKIRYATVQNTSRISRSGERRERSAVPGKTSKISNTKTVLKPTQVDWASSLR